MTDCKHPRLCAVPADQTIGVECPDCNFFYLAADDRELFRASAEFRAAWKAMRARSDARAALPPGSSRARVTTANARWHSACEHVERLRRATRGAA